MKTIEERLAELLAAAPRITPDQREAAVRLLAQPSTTAHPVPAQRRRAA